MALCNGKATSDVSRPDDMSNEAPVRRNVSGNTFSGVCNGGPLKVIVNVELEFVRISWLHHHNSE